MLKKSFYVRMMGIFSPKFSIFIVKFMLTECINFLIFNMLLKTLWGKLKTC